VGNVPATVDKLVIAFDGWGGDVLNPWQCLGTGLLQSYLNLRLMHRDENMQVVPLWATEWKQTPEGIFLTLDPKAKWQDGTPATAEDLRANIEALMGQYAPAFKGTPRMAYMKKVVEEVQVIDATHSNSHFGPQLVLGCDCSSRPRIMKSIKCPQLSKTR
jgi:ABC-type transport system substrate-binding protein